MALQKKKSRIETATILINSNFWRVTKLTAATISGIAAFGVLLMALNFTVFHAKKLNQTIKL